MNGPFFSCVVPVKGARPFIADALASLESQGMGEELEVIVQDGGVGSGGVGELVSGGVERRGVRYYREDDNGQSDALNKGFAKAKGEWLFWLNADDVLLPGALKKVLDRINRTDGIEWFAGNMVIIDSGGRIVSCLKDKGNKHSYIGHPVRVYGPSSFFRRDLFVRVGGLDASLRYCMDTDLWCRFRDAGAWFEKVDEYLWGFRQHAGSTTTGAKNMEEQVRQDAEVAAMHERRGVKMTAWDVRAAQLWRVFDGSYVRGLLDAMWRKGKNWKDL